MSENDKGFGERLRRVKSTVAFEKTDRVPIAPKIASLYASAYDIRMYDVMVNTRLFEDGIVKFFEQFHPDLAWAPLACPILPMETLNTQYIKWPGGGFIMDNTIGLEECNLENLETMFETTLKYGNY